MLSMVSALMVESGTLTLSTWQLMARPSWLAVGLSVSTLSVVFASLEKVSRLPSEIRNCP